MSCIIEEKYQKKYCLYQAINMFTSEISPMSINLKSINLYKQDLLFWLVSIKSQSSWNAGNYKLAEIKMKIEILTSYQPSNVGAVAIDWRWWLRESLIEYNRKWCQSISQSWRSVIAGILLKYDDAHQQE